MSLAALAFAAGAALLQWQPALPSLWWALSLPILGLLAFVKPRAAFLFTFALGFLWAALLAHHRMADWLAPELEGRDLQVVGVVAGLPAVGERSVRFELEVESGDTGVPKKLLLSWYRSPLNEEARALLNANEEAPGLLAGALHPGQRWIFTVRLRRPHGNVNPQGFDYEAWLLERGIGATGYVRNRGGQRKVGERNSFLDWIEKAREAIRDRFLSTLGPTPAAGILAALAVGDQRAISGEEWQLFNRTGVTHLMSISGLHVTLVSGLFAWLVAALWRRVPALALRLPARSAAAAAAIAGALGYTLLAGFGVPAQRTFYMVTVVALALWSGRIASPTRILALALAAVVAFDPWAPLAPGLWLSFGAVLLIFYVASGWHGPESKLAQWGRVQWAITLGLAPAALLLFGQVSVAGPLANAVAIPVVSVVVTPIALVAAVVPLDFLLHTGAWLMEWLLQFLEWCSTLPGALWQQHVPQLWCVLLALAGVQSHQFQRSIDLASYALKNGVQHCVIGGPHPMTCDTSMLYGRGVSFALSEAEGTWMRILQDAIDGELRPVYGQGQRWEKKIDAPVLIPPSKQDMKRYVLPMLGLYPARGCPFTCNFCSVIKIAGREIRIAPPAVDKLLIHERTGRAVEVAQQQRGAGDVVQLFDHQRRLYGLTVAQRHRPGADALGRTHRTAWVGTAIGARGQMRGEDVERAGRVIDARVEHIAEPAAQYAQIVGDDRVAAEQQRVVDVVPAQINHLVGERADVEQVVLNVGDHRRSADVDHLLERDDIWAAAVDDELPRQHDAILLATVVAAAGEPVQDVDGCSGHIPQIGTRRGRRRVLGVKVAGLIAAHLAAEAGAVAYVAQPQHHRDRQRLLGRFQSTGELRALSFHDDLAAPHDHRGDATGGAAGVAVAPAVVRAIAVNLAPVLGRQRDLGAALTRRVGREDEQRRTAEGRIGERRRNGAVRRPHHDAASCIVAGQSRELEAGARYEHVERCGSAGQRGDAAK
jgi:ComEC/Rec2-related protein